MSVVHTSIVAVAYILCCRDMASHLGPKLNIVVVNSPSICMATNHDHINQWCHWNTLSIHISVQQASGSTQKCWEQNPGHQLSVKMEMEKGVDCAIVLN